MTKWSYIQIPFAPAIRETLKALEIAEAKHGRLHAKLLPHLERLFNLCAEHGLERMADETLNRVLHIQRKVLPRGAPEAIRTLCRVNRKEEWQGRAAEFHAAQTQLRTRLRTVARTHGPGSYKAIPILKDLANLFESTDMGSPQFDQAKQLRRNIVERMTTRHGRDHAETLKAKMDLAYEVMFTDGKKTQRFADEILAIHEKKHGMDSAQVLPALNLLNQIVLFSDKQTDMAEELALAYRILRLDEKHNGQENLAVASDLINIVFSHLRTKRNLKEATTFARRAQAIYNRHYGTGNLRTANIASLLAKLETLQGHPEKAEELLEEAASTQEAYLPASFAFFQTMHKLENLADKANNREKKGLYLNRTVTVATRKLGPRHPQTTNARLEVRMFQEGLDRIERIDEKYYRERLKTLEEVYGTDAPILVTAILDLSGWLREHNQLEEATALDAQATAKLRTRFNAGKPVDRRLFAAMLWSLADKELKKGDYARANPLFEECLAISLTQNDGMRRQMAFEGCIRCATGTGRKDDALKYQMMAEHCRARTRYEPDEDERDILTAPKPRRRVMSMSRIDWRSDIPKPPVNCTATTSTNTASEEDAIQKVLPPALQKRAHEGDAVAQNALGMFYYRGEMVPQDVAEAARRFRAAAEQNHTEAQANLGFLYATGVGVQQDWTEAAKWFMRAAEQDDCVAMASIAYCKLHGHGTAKDPNTAMVWLQRSRRPNYSAGKTWLDRLHLKMKGLETHARKAMRQVHHAAMQGDNEATQCMAELYLHGQGDPEDATLALDWLKTAAEAGDKKACRILARLYMPEVNPIIDIDEAAKYCEANSENADPVRGPP